MSENIEEKIEKLQAQFIDILNLDKEQYDKLREGFQGFRELKKKFEGFEHFKNVAEMIDFRVSEKVKHIDLWIETHTLEAGTEILNIKTLLDRIIRMEIKHYEEMIEQLEEIEPQHSQLKDLKRRKHNWEEIKEFHFDFPKWCPGSELCKTNNCNECKWEPFEINVLPCHSFIKFRNGTKKRYSYQEAEFIAPNQILLRVELAKGIWCDLQQDFVLSCDECNSKEECEHDIENEKEPIIVDYDKKYFDLTLKYNELCREKDKFIEYLNALETEFLIDSSSGDVLEVEAVRYSDIEKIIKKLEKDPEKRSSRTNKDNNKRGSEKPE